MFGGLCLLVMLGLGFWAWCIVGIPILMVLGIDRLRVAIPVLVLSYIALWAVVFATGAAYDDADTHQFESREARIQTTATPDLPVLPGQSCA